MPIMFLTAGHVPPNWNTGVFGRAVCEWAQLLHTDYGLLHSKYYNSFILVATRGRPGLRSRVLEDKSCLPIT